MRVNSRFGLKKCSSQRMFVIKKWGYPAWQKRERERESEREREREYVYVQTLPFQCGCGKPVSVVSGHTLSNRLFFCCYTLKGLLYITLPNTHSLSLSHTHVQNWIPYRSFLFHSRLLQTSTTFKVVINFAKVWLNMNFA